MIPWWGWLIISILGLVTLYWFVVLVVVGIVFREVFKDD